MEIKAGDIVRVTESLGQDREVGVKVGKTFKVLQPTPILEDCVDIEVTYRNKPMAWAFPINWLEVVEHDA